MKQRGFSRAASTKQQQLSWQKGNNIISESYKMYIWSWVVGSGAGKDILESLLEIYGLKHWLEIQILDPGSYHVPWPKKDMVPSSSLCSGKEFLNLPPFPMQCSAFLPVPVQLFVKLHFKSRLILN